MGMAEFALLFIASFLQFLLLFTQQINCKTIIVLFQIKIKLNKELSMQICLTSGIRLEK